MPTRVEWHGREVKAELQDNVRKMLTALAFQIEGTAKVNITDNGQVDTGFLRNSGYVYGLDADTFSATDPNGEYTSQKTGETVRRARAPGPEQPPSGGLVVGFAAEYAAYQEMANSFLFRAAEMVAGSRAEASIREVAE